jgi:hypothetical protein
VLLYNNTEGPPVRGSSFKFKFRIGMHIKDRLSLELVYIRNRLGLSKIYPISIKSILPEKDKLTSVWEVYYFEDVLKIINSFDLYNSIRNTTKQLDYLAGRKAYFLYADYKKEILDSNIQDQILSLKNSMNKKRNNFIQSTL